MVVLTGLAGGNAINIVINAVDKFSKTMNNVSTNARKNSKSIAKDLGAGALAFGAFSIAGVAAITSLTKEYAKFEPVQKSFNKLLGEDALDSLELFRKSSKGLVDDFTLMKNANLFFQNIASATPDQFAKITAAAGPLARAVGISVPEAFERLTLGIAKGETELLDELGLKLDATTANRLYADSIGKTTGQLTAEERATAALNNILGTLDDRLARLPQTTDDLASKNDKLAVSFTNLKLTLGEVFAPEVSRTTTSVGNLLDNMTGFVQRNKQVIKSLTAVTTHIAIFIGSVQSLGLAFGLGLVAIVNTISNQITSMVNIAIAGVNKLIQAYNSVASVLGLDTLGRVSALETGEFISSAGLQEKIARTQSTIVGLQNQINAPTNAGTSFAPTQGQNPILVQIENVFGTDATDISNALQDTLSNQIR